MSREGASAHEVLPRLARRLRGVAREEAAKTTVIERWRVIGTSPLIVEEVEGDLVLEDGDPDFAIGVALRQHIATYGIAEGDQMLVVRSGEEWHAFDAVTQAQPTKRAAG